MVVLPLSLSLCLSLLLDKVRVAGWRYLSLSLSPSFVKVKVAWWWCLSLFREIPWRAQAKPAACLRLPGSLASGCPNNPNPSFQIIRKGGKLILHRTATRAPGDREIKKTKKSKKTQGQIKKTRKRCDSTSFLALRVEKASTVARFSRFLDFSLCFLAFLGFLDFLVSGWRTTWSPPGPRGPLCFLLLLR